MAERKDVMSTTLSFEDSLGRLEAIVQKMETGDLKLEESIKLFEEGIKLTKTCHQRLEEAEKKVQHLMKGAPDETEGRKGKA
jgi:exodeoxyribonuclease VII small subunit